MMKNIPVYKHTAAYAREHTELAAYRASNQANTACKEAIEAAIRDHYRDNRLDAAAVDQVVQQFGYDRAFHILAITVCQADWDRRYSPDNRAWANAMSIPANPDAWGTDRNCYLAVNSHPGLVDLFLSQTRKAYAQEQQKTSVRDMLKSCLKQLRRKFRRSPNPRSVERWQSANGTFSLNSALHRRSGK